MLTDDVIELIHQLCPTVKNVLNDARWTQTQPTWGTIVRQRQTSGRNFNLLRAHEVYCDIIVRGAGAGDIGRKDAYETAMRLYKALNIVYPVKAGDTEFIRITTDSAPFEVPAENNCWDFQFGIACTIYYGE